MCIGRIVCMNTVIWEKRQRSVYAPCVSITPTPRMRPSISKFKFWRRSLRAFEKRHKKICYRTVIEKDGVFQAEYAALYLSLSSIVALFLISHIQQKNCSPRDQFRTHSDPNIPQAKSGNQKDRQGNSNPPHTGKVQYGGDQRMPHALKYTKHND